MVTVVLPMGGVLVIRKLEDFRPLAYRIATEFFLPGADDDDVRQEAMIGAWKGLRDYRESAGLSLRNFVALCIRRQLATAVKTARRQKHDALTFAVRRLENAEGEVAEVVDLIEDPRADVVDLLAYREALEHMAAVRLSPIERHALLGIADGYSYAELGADFKRLDNAVQRARRKLVPPTWLQAAA